MLKVCFSVAIGLGREQTFRKFTALAEKYAPDVKIHSYYDTKQEGCGAARYYLWKKYARKYDLYIQLDDDMELTNGWYTRVLRAYNKFPSVNLFTTRVEENGLTYSMGSDIHFKDNVILLVNRGNNKGQFTWVDYAPGGCFIACRRALQKIEPHKIAICEELDWYGQWRRYGLGRGISINEATVIHNIKDNPRVKGFRTPENLLSSTEFLYKEYGFTFIGDDRSFRYHCGVEDTEELKKLMERASKFYESDRLGTST